MSRDGNSHGSDMSQAKTASPKPSPRAPCRVGYAEKLLDGHHPRVDIPDHHAITAHKSFLQKRLEENLWWNVPHAIPSPPPSRRPNRLKDWTELNWTCYWTASRQLKYVMPGQNPLFIKSEVNTWFIISGTRHAIFGRNRPAKWTREANIRKKPEV